MGAEIFVAKTRFGIKLHSILNLNNSHIVTCVILLTHTYKFYTFFNTNNRIAIILLLIRYMEGRNHQHTTCV